MSRAAHATVAASGLEALRKALDSQIQAEVREAKRTQAATGCTWSEALRLAVRGAPTA